MHCLLTKFLTPLTNFICQRLSQVKVWTLYHEGLIEKEIQFCYLFEISVFFFFWANLSVQNQGAFWILSTIAVETVKKQGSETSESWFFGSFQIFFIFKIFGIFGNLKIDFSINVSKCFPTIVNSFRVMLLFS